MKAISCIKQVYNLDMILENDWVVDPSTATVDVHYASRIMSPFDETALELMLTLKDNNPGAIVEAITVGAKPTEDILRKALAVGVSKVTRVDFDQEDVRSPQAIAQLLYSQIITQKFDLVLCGKQTDLRGFGQTGQILAEKLGWPCFTDVFHVEYINECFHLKRLSNNTEELIVIKGPIVITVLQSDNRYLRMATLRDTIIAKQKEIRIIDRTTAKHQLEGNTVNYHFKQFTIEKNIQKCEYLEPSNNQSVYQQLIRIVDRHKERKQL